MSSAAQGRLRGRVRRREAGSWFGHGRTRALLALGVVAVLGATGTSAFWTDSTSLSLGSVSTGSLDLQVQTPGDAGWSHVGTATTATDATLTAGDLTPGEAVAFDVAVRNVGNPDLQYAVSVARGGTWTFTGAPILVRFHTGTASNPATTPRAGACSGTALGSGPVAVTASPQLVVPDRLLTGGGDTTAGQAEDLCLVVSMAVDADGANQGQSGTLQLDFTANQVAP